MSINDLDKIFFENNWLNKNENMKVLNITIFCVNIYCLYDTLNGDSREFIYTSKVALYIDKDSVSDRTSLIITISIHHHFMLCVSQRLCSL